MAAMLSLMAVRRYILLPAHVCAEDERRAALALVDNEFGAAARVDVAEAMRNMCRDGSGGSCRSVPVVWLAIERGSRAVVGHALWQSAVVKSARPGGAAVKNYAARKMASGDGDEIAIRKFGKLHGLTQVEVDSILAKQRGRTLEPAPANTVPSRLDPEYARFFKMIEAGVPIDAVKQSVQMAGLHPDAMYHPEAPAPVVDPYTTQRQLDIPKVKTCDAWLDQSSAVVLNRLVVKAKHRSRGLGKALTLVGVAHCSELGASRVLGTARSKELIGWYMRMGAVASIEGNEDDPCEMRKWTSRQLQADPGDHGYDRLEVARTKVLKMCGGVVDVWQSREIVEGAKKKNR
uniref:N-acetyltransferase domain-containing protein n=1 Tax=Corethron hystrix TaxID=216773 RepID=A0A7S1FZ58_9STRA